MPDWLKSATQNDTPAVLQQSAVHLLEALLLGVLVAIIYRWTRGRGADRRFVATLVLLTVLLCVTTIVVGDNVAGAFRLVGALSIVRFRTVVEDTRDTAFVICAVVMGLAAGAGYLGVPVLALVVVAVTAKIFGSKADQSPATALAAFRLNVRVAPDFTQREALQREIAAATTHPMLVGIESVRAGTAVERSYAIELAGESGADALIGRLSAIEGVVAVEVVRGGR
ncbi:MAG: DUF4956 domain-containing protein [Planctomycetota bacterium]